MKKRILSMLLTLCMIFPMLPTMAFAADGDAASGISVANEADLNTALSNATGAATIILTENITITSTVVIGENKDITLTGSGGLLRSTSFSGGGMISISSGGKLTIENITIDGNNVNSNNMGSAVYVYGSFYMKSGVIQNNSSQGGWSGDGGGGAVNVCYKGIFNMSGGTIKNNNAVGEGSKSNGWGGGVYVSESGSFIMSGGSITDNKAGYGGGGVYVNAMNIMVSGSFSISGAPIISGNKTGTIDNNVYLAEGSTIALSGSLSDQSNIGITVRNMPASGDSDVSVAVSNGTYAIQSSDARAFSSDKATNAGIKLSNSKIVMSAAAKASELTISGSVSDYTGGKNTLSDIVVSLFDVEDSTFARPLGSAVTDASGNYSIQATVKPGNYVAHIAEKENCYNSSTSDTKAISTANVTGADITLAKYFKSSVVLNTPVFTNDKLGYSFKYATINSFDAVTSITFSATKSTIVKYVPTFLTPTSKLESIDGDTRTATYVFEKGISVSQAEEFIRGIIFEYKADAEISITVDNNPTKLPDGAKITEFKHPDGKKHYYMFVPFVNGTANLTEENILTWQESYNKAKTYRYMGMIGYLATITNEAEDKVLDNVSMSGGWSGGSRYTQADDSAIAPAYNAVMDSNFKWACGPEHGNSYYYFNSTSNKGPVDNAYNGFKDTTEPNDAGNSERCMQIHHLYKPGLYTWNDLPYNATISIYTNKPYVTGYFVEFSNYIGGMDSQHSDDKTAVGKYNLATDGDVQSVATVTLNNPVYGIGNQSVFSFDNATITNIEKIYSLTIKLDNYTNVLSKPATPAVSNELKNIAGDTNTITYQFKDGITKDEAQSFLRGLKFRYGGLKDSSTTNVSITVDGNSTNLPDGASITEYNGHYYMFVPADSNGITWPQAYNMAKTFSYMGLKGYLATITSKNEDAVLTNISTKGAWSAGSRMLKADGTKIADEDSYTLNASQFGNEFYWACGPEAGLVYFTGKTATTGSTPTGIYKNWGNGEPSGTDFYGEFQEVCMQVNFTSRIDPVPKWNDLQYNYNDMNLTFSPKGYFVEFSDYENGRVDNYVANATGKSTVPIIVTKGDVFNTVKDGGTYYVDTVLSTFDRNITNITVNGSAFTSGSKLSGDQDKDITYTIVATDLGGNTATTIVKMKTIASISEPIKNLTVNNVTTNDIPAIVTAKTTLKAIDTTTASDKQKTEITNAIQNCNNLYFALFNANATVANGNNGWYKNGVSDITLTAPDGFEISTSKEGVWTSSITIDNSDGNNKTATYYLKETATDEISSEKTFFYKVDTQAPTGKLTIKNDQFTSFLNSITFGLLFNSTVDVTVSGDDTLSDIAKLEVYKSNVELTKEQLSTVDWTEYTSAITENAKDGEKFIYYARITDNAGNVVIVNSQGAEFDLTAPVINGVTNGETYYTTQIITTKDANEVVITVNGNEFLNGGKIDGNQSKTYEIIATDKAGNTTNVTVAMKPINDISDILNDIKENDVTQDDQKKIENIKKKAEAVDTTNATDEEKKALKDTIDKCDLLLKKIADASNKPDIPKTSDNSNITLWIALLFVSGGVLTTIEITTKRRKANCK